MPQVTVTVEELEVVFPFEPYDIQKDLMTKVVQCLRMRANGLLESPTGTGKTLSLLCASLAWQQKQRNHFAHIMRSLKSDPSSLNGNPFDRVSKIIYASRTHSQLSQAIGEMKRCYYKKAKAVVLGSRDHLCIHEEVSRLPTSSAKIMACHSRVQAHSCSYYNNLSKRKEEVVNTLMDQPIADIEDLLTKGKVGKFCPFFMSRELVKEADIVFMPYNYILDPKLRTTHGIDLKDAVIILDEGHNIARVCEESASFEIRSSMIALCIGELTKALVDLNDTSQQIGTNALTKDLSLGNLVSLKQSFLKLEQELDKIEVKPEGYIMPGQDILCVLIGSGFPPSLFARITNDLDGVSSFLSGNNFESTGCDRFAGILRVLSSQSMLRDPKRFGDSYKVYVELEESKKEPSNRVRLLKSGAPAKVFHFWCFSPAIGLEAVRAQGPRSILLASGTLSPMSFLTEELAIPFAIQITNPHIIGDKQLFASVVKTGPGEVVLSSSFKNRSDPTYLKSLGELILKVFSVVPKGVLIFFPSYSVMEICTKSWQSNGMWDAMAQKKKVLVEPRGQEAFLTVMNLYYSSVKVGTGASLMAVCRGKVSEGLDFTDDNGRAVIITGIPYSPAKDPQVLAKQLYLTTKAKGMSSLNMDGRCWYQLEATRALNQAIGRIIRHAQDYGAILLCDERCDYSDVKKNLSPWIQSRLKSYTNFDETLRNLAKFFGSEVQRERIEHNMQLLKKSTKPSVRNVQPISEENIPSYLDMEDLYGSRLVVEEVSSGRGRLKPNESIPLHENPPPSQTPTKSWQKLLNGLDSIVEAPFFPYGDTPKMTVTSTFETNDKKRRKLRIALSNSSFSTSSAAAEANNFQSVKEFWVWVKGVLSADDYVKMIKAIKRLKSDKNITYFTSEIKCLFNVGQRENCMQGLKLFLSEEELKKAKVIWLP